MRRRAEMTRMSRDELFMTIAKVIAQRSTCPRKAVGAVIVRDSRSISMGYNGSPSGSPHCTEEGCLQADIDSSCDRTIHAEINAILFAAREGISTIDSVLYTTSSPCLHCAKAIIQAGIKEIVYDEEYRLIDGLRLLRNSDITTRRYNGPYSVSFNTKIGATDKVLPEPTRDSETGGALPGKTLHI